MIMKTKRYAFRVCAARDDIYHRGGKVDSRGKRKCVDIINELYAQHYDNSVLLRNEYIINNNNNIKKSKIMSTQLTNSELANAIKQNVIAMSSNVMRSIHLASLCRVIHDNDDEKYTKEVVNALLSHFKRFTHGLRYVHLTLQDTEKGILVDSVNDIKENSDNVQYIEVSNVDSKGKRINVFRFGLLPRRVNEVSATVTTSTFMNWLAYIKGAYRTDSADGATRRKYADCAQMLIPDKKERVSETRAKNISLKAENERMNKENEQMKKEIEEMKAMMLQMKAQLAGQNANK